MILSRNTFEGFPFIIYTKQVTARAAPILTLSASFGQPPAEDHWTMQHLLTSKL